MLGFASENDYDDFDDEGPTIEDDATVRPGRVLRRGDRFEYLFDYGDGWRHRCEVLATREPEGDLDGDGTLPLPDLPLVTMAWGSLPDQYGRPGHGIDPWNDLDEDPYPERLRDIAPLWAEAMTARQHAGWPDEATPVLLAWLRLGRPPRRSEIDRQE